MQIILSIQNILINFITRNFGENTRRQSYDYKQTHQARILFEIHIFANINIPRKSGMLHIWHSHLYINGVGTSVIPQRLQLNMTLQRQSIIIFHFESIFLLLPFLKNSRMILHEHQNTPKLLIAD
jgi:hypothetical protein